MALDGIYLHSLIYELNSKLSLGKIEKISQPEKDEIILAIRNNKETYKLLISASSVYPKIHITNIAKENPMTPPMFCMVLRKYLTGARLLEINQFETDRIVIFKFEALDELGYIAPYTMVVEIMGKYSNITLIRDKDNIIMDSIKHVTRDMSSKRILLPGVKFIMAPPSDKLNPLTLNKDDFKNLDINFEDNKFFSKKFIGVSSQLSVEIMYIIKKTSIPYDEMENIFNLIKNHEYSFTTYYDEDKPVDFYCIPLYHLKIDNKKIYNSSSEQIEEFYKEKDTSDRLGSKTSAILKLVQLNIEKCEKKILIMENTLNESIEKDKIKLYGELLTANVHLIKNRDKEINVVNYYDENLSTLTIPLDEFKTPSENIQSYFKKYNKMKRSEEMAKKQIDILKSEIEYLNSVLVSILRCENATDIEDIKQELVKEGYIKNKKSNKKVKDRPSKPMHFLSSDGIDIYVGKNNTQNDYLTTKFSDKSDIWLHTKDIPGSHVIIKHSKGELPEKTLIEAANLAAFNSKAKEGSKVLVDYTRIKNVKKPNGAKAGMVIYENNKTLNVESIMPEGIKKIKS